MTTPLILASTSIYRKQLLSKLSVPFQCLSPDCDEDSYKAKIKDPLELAKTLALKKAESLATPHNCVIGGDQLATIDGIILGKPKTAVKALEQLKLLQGRTHQLITAVHVIYRQKHFPILDITELTLHKFSDEELCSYIEKDNPLDCAASYKIEKSGICLMAKINCKDFSAIQGLPMMELTTTLRAVGYKIF